MHAVPCLRSGRNISCGMPCEPSASTGRWYFGSGRQRIVADCHQLRLDADSCNVNCDDDKPIQSISPFWRCGGDYAPVHLPSSDLTVIFSRVQSVFPETSPVLGISGLICLLPSLSYYAGTSSPAIRRSYAPKGP
jgi:hypothetical protein